MRERENLGDDERKEKPELGINHLSYEVGEGGTARKRCGPLLV